MDKMDNKPQGDIKMPPGDIKMPPPKYKWGEIKAEETTFIEFPSGCNETILTYDGTSFPLHFAKMGTIPDIRINYPKIRKMTIRDDDVLICAYPKAGTHWIWEITKMLRKGKAEHESARKESVMLEFHTPEEFDAMQSPRTLNTHLLYRLIPEQILQKKSKIIFIQRNPKDVLVSLYGHMKAFDPHSKKPWEDFLFAFWKHSIGMYMWPDYTLQWEKAIAENSDLNVYCMFYEELKKDAVGEIKKLAKFLEVDCSDQLIADITEKCNFKNMKDSDKNKPGLGPVLSSETLNKLYRKGVIGDWKNWFTVAQNEVFEAEYKEHMKDSKQVFTYE